MTKLDAANLYAMGPRLLAAVRACLAAKVTPVVLHYTGKNLLPLDKPLELHQLAFAGIAEFARQWLADWLAWGRQQGYAW